MNLHLPDVDSRVDRPSLNVIKLTLSTSRCLCSLAPVWQTVLAEQRDSLQSSPIHPPQIL